MVEDERRIADFIQRGLKAEGYTVLLAPDGETAQRLIAQETFDLVVLDLMLPGLSGQEVCRQMRARGDFTPVLMVSALDRTDDRISGLRLGADDYLVKPFDFDELVARIQALLRRAKGGVDNQGDRNVLQVNEIHFDTRSLTLTVRGRAVALTERERQILLLLLREPDRIHSRERILNAVWGTTEDPLTNVVDVYVARLRKKLGDEGKAIETIRGVGYRLSKGRF